MGPERLQTQEREPLSVPAEILGCCQFFGKVLWVGVGMSLYEDDDKRCLSSSFSMYVSFVDHFETSDFPF
jgi:hypothetical protein